VKHVNKNYRNLVAKVVKIRETRIAIAATPGIGTGATAVLEKITNHESQIMFTLVAKSSSYLPYNPSRPPISCCRRRTHHQSRTIPFSPLVYVYFFRYFKITKSMERKLTELWNL
jgi:hypothetical protein